MSEIKKRILSLVISEGYEQKREISSQVIDLIDRYNISLERATELFESMKKLSKDSKIIEFPK